jgi:hypothetical protein
MKKQRRDSHNGRMGGFLTYIKNVFTSLNFFFFWEKSSHCPKKRKSLMIPYCCWPGRLFFNPPSILHPPIGKLWGGQSGPEPGPEKESKVTVLASSGQGVMP